MQRISAAALCCALVAVFATLAFTGKPATVLNRPTSSISKTAARQAMYYWYTYPSDTYNDYQTLSNEELEMWIYYDGVLINTNPAGGTLIEEGYPTNVFPHTGFPSYYLWAHF